MADPAIVSDLLLARAALMETTGPALPVAMPDVAFQPPIDSQGGALPYLRIDLFSNEPFWEGLASGRIDQGLLQVTVVWPEGEGIVAARRAASDVMDHFHKGLRLFGPATRVTVNKEPWAASPITEAAETLTPITISWTAV